MAYDVAAAFPPSVIWTEVSEIIQFYSDANLDVLEVPHCACYNRKNYLTRIVSTICYLLYVFTKILFHSSKSAIFLVTSPPFLGVVGFIFKKIRRQKYVMLVYDILPNALIGAGAMKEGLLSRLWRRLNKMVFNHADAVITIGEYMAANLEKEFDASKTLLKRISVIHNWADVDLIKPLPKEENPFVQEHQLQEKFIVMYSGNIGATHDMVTLIEAARELKDHPRIKFMIIGEGAKKQYVIDSKEKYNLDNLQIMSYLPQDQLVYSLPAADISIVSISSGVEGYLVPCKFYAYLAAGTAVIGICNEACEVADIIKTENCGAIVLLGDVKSLVDAILYYYDNPLTLTQVKTNSRRAAVYKYSRKNTQQYVDMMKNIIPERVDDK